MEIINHTPFQYLLYRSAIDDEKIAASIVIRVIYDVSNNQQEQLVGISGLELGKTPRINDYGYFESDLIFRRNGVDVSIYGHAYADKPGKTSEMKVLFYYNRKLKASLNVFGKRYWEKKFSRIEISKPQIFDKIPLKLEYAYGGKDIWDGLEIPYISNPYGKGFYLSKENAINNPLPNLEFDAFKINSWFDQPNPSGFGQFPICEFRIKRGHHWNGDQSIKALKPEFYNTAAPNMILKNISIGDHLEVIGASINKVFSVQVPSDQFIANIRLGNTSFVKPLYIDQIGLVPEEKKMFISYRYHFLYRVTPMEKRILEIKNK